MEAYLVILQLESLGDWRLAPRQMDKEAERG